MLKTMIKTFERKKYTFGTFPVMMEGCWSVHGNRFREPQAVEVR